MVGANYMGGKRNTVRAKSKDIVGRTQRRHFGKRRFASALCVVTHGARARSSGSTLSSVLPDITLAHARCDASTGSGVASSITVFDGDRLYSSTLLSNTPRRNKPSTVLGALDISDRVYNLFLVFYPLIHSCGEDTSTRAAIDRILQQPNFVGISTSSHQEAAYSEHMQTPVTLGLQIDAHLDTKVQWPKVIASSSTHALGSQDLDTHSEIVSKVWDPQLSYPPIPGHWPTVLTESNLNMRYCATERSIPSPSDPPCDVAARDALDDEGCVKVRSSSRVNPFLCTEGDEPEWPGTFPVAVHPLPRSSPFPSSSQLSEDLILDLDTSPSTAVGLWRSDDHSEEHIDYVNALSLHSVRQPISSQPLGSFRILPICEGSAGMDEARFTDSCTTGWDEEAFEGERSQKTWCNDDRAFPSIGNDHFSGRDYIQNLTSQKVAEDDGPSNVSVDFLSDPHPWETVNRILELKFPKSFEVRSVTINFTKDREGVGYNSSKRSSTCNALFSDATSSETRINGKPTDDIHVEFNTNSSEPGLEVSTGDNRTAMDTPDSWSANNSIRSPFDTLSSVTTPVVDPCSHALALQGAPSIPMIHCAKKCTTFPTPLAITVGTDVDMTFDGPCLFDDSDLEEDE